MSEDDLRVRYLDLDDLGDVIRNATDLEPAVRDLGLLASALHRPQATAFGEEAYPDLFTKAAALLESLVRDHALIDGNRRTAWLAGWLFLRDNGLRLSAPDEAFDLLIGIAERRVELAETAAALEAWTLPV